jgi:transposase InsO family protein
MNITMSDTRIYTIPELIVLLESLDGVSFRAENKTDAYDWIEEQLFRYKYDRLDKPSKGVVQAYLRKYTSYSHAQLARLIAAWRSTHHVKLVHYERHSFTRTYTRDDMVLLAKVDTAHNVLSGPATAHILSRAYTVFGDKTYERLAGISPSHLYNLRNTLTYHNHAQVFTHTHGPKNTLGERRKPEPNGRPGYLRIDTVHQGDSTDGKKGIYHINFVDEVTQWELCAAVETISDRHMLPVLLVILEQFPFVIHEFHSDNGSEFINKKVLAMLRRLHATLSKSRPRRHNDNALVETKNGSIIRKAWGYDHIPARQAPVLNQWYEDWFNTYLNFHRPCGFATVVRDKKGKERPVYRPKDYMTPYEKFRSLPNPEQYLKPGITFDQLDFVAYALPDTEFAELMEQAKDRLPIWEKQLSIVVEQSRK